MVNASFETSRKAERLERGIDEYGLNTIPIFPASSNTSIYNLIHAGEFPAVKLGTKTIRVNRRALEEYLQRAQQMAVDFADGGDGQ